jgi:hypothetical protein
MYTYYLHDAVIICALENVMKANLLESKYEPPSSEPESCGTTEELNVCFLEENFLKTKSTSWNKM